MGLSYPIFRLPNYPQATGTGPGIPGYAPPVAMLDGGHIPTLRLRATLTLVAMQVNPPCDA